MALIPIGGLLVIKHLIRVENNFFDMKSTTFRK